MTTGLMADSAIMVMLLTEMENSGVELDCGEKSGVKVLILNVTHQPPKETSYSLAFPILASLLLAQLQATTNFFLYRFVFLWAFHIK